MVQTLAINHQLSTIHLALPMEPTSPSPQADPRPTLTARDLSYHEALAGIAAREAAQTSGGPRHAIRALIHTADSAPSSFAIPHSSFLKGLPLRSDDLLVTLCLGLHAEAFGTDPRAEWAHEKTATRMRAIAALAFLFTTPGRAYTLLDEATDTAASEEQRQDARRAYRDEVTAFAADFGPGEIETLTRHLLKLAGFHPMADPEEAASPDEGEPRPPSPPARSWWRGLVQRVAGCWPMSKLWPPNTTCPSVPSSTSPFPPDSPSLKPAPPASTPATA
jgi:hypothetical protein